MIVLGIDTAGGACSVAITRDTGPVAVDVVPMRHGQAQHLAPAIERVLARSELRPSSVDLIGVTVGPGSFTGLRVGLAAAGGLALATGARIVGISSFEAVSARCRPLTSEQRRAIVIDSRRAELFVQRFDADGITGSANWLTLEAIVDELSQEGVSYLAGDGAPKVAALLDRRMTTVEASGPIDPVAVCCLALAGAAGGQSDPPRPVYLRPPDAKVPGRSVPDTKTHAH